MSLIARYGEVAVRVLDEGDLSAVARNREGG